MKLMTSFRSKRILFGGLAAFLVLLVVESVSYIGIGAIHGHWFNLAPFQDARRSLIGAEPGAAPVGGSKPGWVETVAMHPFVGYVWIRHAPSGNSPTSATTSPPARSSRGRRTP